MTESGQSGRPVLRIVSGEPNAEELAAVAVALLARAAQDQQPATAPRVGGWADPAARLRAPLRPGPGAWRASRD